jgi:hypothetical protein
LYVGTDHNVYISLDRGKNFHTLSAEFPDVPVHDLVVQAKAKDLVIGTHGRSMYKLNIAAVQQLTGEVLASPLHLYELPKRRFNANWGKKQPWQELKDPELPVLFYAAAAGKTTWTVKNKEGGLELQKGAFDCKKGLNTFVYTLDLQENVLKKYTTALQEAQKDSKKPVEIAKADMGKYYVRKGTYVLELEKDGKKATKEFTVE